MQLVSACGLLAGFDQGGCQCPPLASPAMLTVMSCAIARLVQPLQHLKLVNVTETLCVKHAVSIACKLGGARTFWLQLCNRLYMVRGLGRAWHETLHPALPQCYWVSVCKRSSITVFFPNLWLLPAFIESSNDNVIPPPPLHDLDNLIMPACSSGKFPLQPISCSHNHLFDYSWQVGDIES